MSAAAGKVADFHVHEIAPASGIDGLYNLNEITSIAYALCLYCRIVFIGIINIIHCYQIDRLASYIQILEINLFYSQPGMRCDPEPL